MPKRIAPYVFLALVVCLGASASADVDLSEDALSVLDTTVAVSYTHLTLPTSDLV